MRLHCTTDGNCRTLDVDGRSRRFTIDSFSFTLIMDGGSEKAVVSRGATRDPRTTSDCALLERPVARTPGSRPQLASERALVNCINGRDGFDGCVEFISGWTAIATQLRCRFRPLSERN
jgi:hypothetical protein